ncbi:MAG TPA: amino acid ABC transporter ATP-binding protein [Spirochaetota bacterium]|nr:amino acid ABC transporter ATP-binding protein [Spirochaetota bacterium]
MNDASVMIRAEGIVKIFGHHRVLNGVSCEIRRGEVVAIIGPSGSGKSTFLRCLNGLESINEGCIRIEGDLFAQADNGRHTKIDKNEIRKMTRKVGMVFQHFNLFPHKTVLENVMEAPLAVNGMSRSDAIRMAESLLSKVGLADRKNFYPSKISGGQKQRVAIARALGMHPDIMLFDEPTSALDPELTGEVLKVIRDLAREQMTMVIVTHEMEFARRIADRILFMDEGKIVLEGTPDTIFDTCENERVRTFLSRMPALNIDEDCE